MLNIYIGYDPREAIAFHVCVNSIIRHASVPVSIIPLALNTLEGYKESHTDGSNQFIYSRFLVPHLNKRKGWALFIDGDMIVKDDVKKLFDLIEPDKSVMVVKHDYKTKYPGKYLGAPNQDYPRKNWSSVILWNCEQNDTLTPEFIQTATGAQLHRFTWLHDDSIGELPIEWNWLSQEHGNYPEAKLVHYTIGTPCFNEYSDSPMAHSWHNERILVNHCEQKK